MSQPKLRFVAVTGLCSDASPEFAFKRVLTWPEQLRNAENSSTRLTC